MQNPVVVYAAALVRKNMLSDENLKELSSEGLDMKDMALQILENGPPFSDREVDILTEAIQMDGHDFKEQGDYWRDDLHEQYADKILQAYADNIDNYEYTYKPEAQSLDPNDPDLDPSVKHVGPMAQDIEKANPAAIKETEDGVKTVDTGRLALMNAGVIASLAREVAELKEKLK